MKLRESPQGEESELERKRKSERFNIGTLKSNMK
jgi:hypothetical protein